MGTTILLEILKGQPFFEDPFFHSLLTRGKLKV